MRDGGRGLIAYGKEPGSPQSSNADEDSSDDEESQEACCRSSSSEWTSDKSDSDGAARSVGRRKKVLGGVANLRSYNTLLRLRTAYAVGTASVALISVALGASLQVFFTVFERGGLSDDSPWTGFKVMVLTPLFFCFVAVLADEMWDLLLDALDHPPLVSWRAMMMVAGLSPRCVDIVIVFIAEVLPLVSVILAGTMIDDVQFAEVTAYYFVGTQLSALAMALLQLVAHVWAIWKGRAPKVQQVATGLDSRHVIVGQTDSALVCEDSKLRFRVSHSETDDRPEKLMRGISLQGAVGSQSVSKHTVHALVLLVCIVLAAGAVLGVTGSASCAKALLGMSIALVLMSRTTAHLFPGLVGVAFNTLIGLFVVIAISLLLFSSSSIMDLDEHTSIVPNIFEPPLPNASFSMDTTDHGKYPVCMMSWGRPSLPAPKRLSVLDLAVFADAVYYSYKDEVMSIVHNATQGTDLDDVELEYLENMHTIGRWGTFRLKSSGVRVLAIRGTTSRQDAMADADMYAAIKVMQFFNMFVPVLSLYPAVYTRGLLGISAAHRYLHQSPLWKDLVIVANRAQKQSTKEGVELVITGHSLGGALAIIAGAWTGAQTVAFSPPGQRYSTYRFGVSNKGVEKSVTIVKPRRDLVPEVDQQIGFTQVIECSASALMCHSISRSACELFRSCGDPRGRTMKQNCDLFG